MTHPGFIAFDLGASSGRAMLAGLDGGRITLHEAHRFDNRPQRLPSGYHWNLQQLWDDIVEGLGRAARLADEHDIELCSVGMDTWGVDCALLGRSGQLLGLPYAYRDDRFPAAFEKTIEKLSEAEIYDATGNQFLPFNTLFQMMAWQISEPGVLAQARHMLNMPDLLHYFLTGEPTNEATIASTTQMTDARTGDWARSLLTKLDLPTEMLGPITPAGSPLGPLREHVAEQAGTSRLNVILPGSHDTASAVAAVPATDETPRPWAYISSGTWSLLGAELDRPVITPESRQLGFANEGGIEGKIRLLKNIAGLWLIQQCRRQWADGGDEFTFEQLTQLAAAADPMRTLINPDDPVFASPGDMPARIAAFAKQSQQQPPQSPGQFVRCCLESLALCYRRTLGQLEQLIGGRVEVLHIVGGGGHNALLNQMTADAIGRPVIVGPFEATAVGNALTQAIGAGRIADLAQLRQTVARSFDLQTYQPHETARYDQQLERFEMLLGSTNS